MATVSVVRYQHKKKTGDDKSPMVYALKPESGESKLYSIKSLARKIESVGSFSVKDAGRVMQSFVRSMKKVPVAGDKVEVDSLGIFYTTFTCPGMEQEKDCAVRNIIHVDLRFKTDDSLRFTNNSTATTRGEDNNMIFELIPKNALASGGSGDGGGSGGGGGSNGGPGSGGNGGEEEAPDSTVQSGKYVNIINM